MVTDADVDVGVPGVHVLPLRVAAGERERTFHAAAVETDHGVLLADTGLPGTMGVLSDALEGAGLALADVSTVLLTHQDPDHVGNAAAVAGETDALVVAHPGDAPAVSGAEPLLKADPGDRPEPVDVDVEVVDGVRFRTHAGPMRVVATPGHTPGHVSLHFPEHGLLLAGDAVTATGDDGGLAPPNPEFTPDEETAMESVARLADLDVERVVAYHGGPVEATGGDLRALLDG
jgi:glyoxylase-like metal-dependent hydrolase (beta-lactamase superfamily II)